MLALAVVTVLILLLFVLILTRPSKTKKFQEFIEPPGSIIFGHIQLLEKGLKNLQTVIPFMTDNFSKYGHTVQFRVGMSGAPILRGFATMDYKLIEFILTSNKILTKSINYKFLQPWLRNGLIISDGNYWRRHRKILTPAFHFGILKEFVEIFDRVSDVFVEKLKTLVGESVDVHPLVTLCTLDIICETAMGTKIDAQSGENCEYVRSVQSMCELVISRFLKLVKVFDSTFWMTPDFYRQRKFVKILHDYTKEVLKSKKENSSNDHYDKGGKMAFLDLLLKLSDDSGKLLTDEEVQEEIDTFMFAGHDTTSSAICFTLYCLAQHPEVQERILREQKDIFGDVKNPVVTYSDLQNMKYLENAIKESLRLYPPVPIIGRYCDEDVIFGDYIIHKNSNMIIYTYNLHRNPQVFPEPEKFNPDRFENFDNSLPFSYIPFSAGPRNCIGQKFAMLELKSVISKIVRNFELYPATPNHTLILSVEAVLRSANGIKLSWKLRN